MDMASGDLLLAWEILQPLIIMGFALGVVVAVVIGAARIGWHLAPYIIFGSALLWFFGG
jgi:hypothetical protein